ncbi:hypothetical protein D5S17_20180 [Pseudonocardiaceae bacterium YIM PH 21723]|nr:hypothetical protein D5S17_20180 [Pseudonocardiaceae bacterium YIM PH 21723]
MGMNRADFLTTARIALDLVRDPVVARSWTRPSALPQMSVGALAAHVVYQFAALPELLTSPEPVEPVVPLVGHYARSSWVGAELDAEINVSIRAKSDKVAGGGPDEVVAGAEAVLSEVDRALPGAPDRLVRLPFWGDWSLRLEDYLVTRAMELIVHSDDLAFSVGLATPEFPEPAAQTVVDLLSRLAVRKHGTTPVIRALTRRERAPRSIAAF